jgi:hypothetical protein
MPDDKTTAATTPDPFTPPEPPPPSSGADLNKENDKLNLEALTALQSGLSSILSIRDGLTKKPGHQAICGAYSAFNSVLNLIEDEVSHAQRIIEARRLEVSGDGK